MASFQGSADRISSRFRSRNVYDPSRRLASTAKDLERKNIEEVKQIEKQNSQISTEYERIFNIATAKDKYNLQNLATFSKTLTTLLDTAAKEIYKPYQDAKREEGITLGEQAAQGDKEALDKVALSIEQTNDIKARIAEQQANSSLTADEIEKLQLSLEEKARLINIRKLGSNVAWGFRRGYLKEAANGWPAHRANQLTDSKETIDYNGEKDALVVGNFWNYDLEQQQAILSHVQKKYINENDQGFNENIVQSELIKPITEENSRFRKEVLGIKDEEQAKKELDVLTFELNESISKLDGVFDTKEDEEALRQAVNSSLLRMKSILRRMDSTGQLKGTLQEGANRVLKQIFVDALSSPDVNTETLDYVRSFLETEKFEVLGLTKKAKYDKNGELIEGTGGQTLAKIWPNEFNVDKIIGEAIKKRGERIRAENLAVVTDVKTQIANAFQNYYNEVEVEEGVLFDKEQAALVFNQIRQDYGNIPGVNELVSNALSELDEPKFILASDARKEAEHILKFGDGEILASETLKWPKSVLEEYKDQIVTKKFVTSEGEKEVQKTFLSDFDQVFQKYVAESVSKQDREELGEARVKEFAGKKLVELAKAFQVQDQSLTNQAALSKAAKFILKELHDDNDGDNATVSENQWFVWDAGTKRWLNEEFNIVPTGDQESANQVAVRYSKMISTLRTDIANAGGKDIIATKAIGIKPEEFRVTGTDLPTIFHQIRKEDTRERTVFEIYNLQAELTEGVEPINWEEKYPEIQKIINQNKRLAITDKECLASGSTRGIGRVCDKEGFIDSVTFILAINPENEVLVTNNEYQNLLDQAGLPPMTYKELIEDEKALNIITNLKAIQILSEINENSDNRDLSIRKAATAMKFGLEKAESWNEGEYDIYSAAALRAYLSGDFQQDLVGVDSTQVLVDDDEGTGEALIGSVLQRDLANSIEQLTLDLQEIESMEVPEKMLNLGKLTHEQYVKEMESYGDLGIHVMGVKELFGIANNYIPNPQYKLYANRKQAIQDRILILEAIEGNRSNMGDRFYNKWNENFNRSFRQAVTRTLGQEKWEEILETAAEDPNWGNAASNERIMKRLLIQEPEFQFLFNPDDYTLGSDKAGFINRYNLTSVEGGPLPGNNPFREGARETNVLVRQDVAGPLREMLAAAKADGFDFGLTDGYRTFAEQEDVFKKDQAKIGDPEAEKKNPKGFRSPVAGESYHNIGTGVDINYISPEGLQWLKDNANKYGFKPFEDRYDLEFEEKESWHWEYRPD
tara:strand:+ start:2424 stop:6206 length:3783 start_codon:yes stop_codon:yes gene_type:complete